MDARQGGGEDKNSMITAADDPRSLRRVEDERFVTGKGRYVDDLPLAGQLFAAVLRSPHAHARIVSIATEAAEDVPGVRGVFTARDLLADGIGPLPCYMDLRSEEPLIVPPRYPLAIERARHVGDPVALVVADSREAAREALDHVDVDYDILDAVVDPRRALEDRAPQIWDEAPGNLAFHYKRGDFEKTAAAFAGAAHVVELSLVNNRIAAAALEPRTAVGAWDEASDRYLLTLSGASVHSIRRELADGVFRVPHDQIDLTVPDVGGGFGMKNVTYPEYALLLWAAKRLRRPIRWTAERVDEFTSGVHGRDNLTRVRLALDLDGRILGLWVETIANLGAYVSSGGPGSSTLAPTPAMGGLYAIPAIAMEVHGAFTNTAPIDAYRGAGKPEANYIIERILDVAAHRLGLDPVDLRRRNFIREFPYRNAMGAVIDSGRFADNLDRVLAAADQAGFAARKAQSAARGCLRGLGVACFLETARGQPNEEAWIRFAPDGTIELAVGTHSNGQGHETSFVQLVADRLGLPLDTFHFVQGDTRRVPRGGGHGGARSLHMGGTALLLAAEDMLRKARPIAARLLQAVPEDVTYTDGAFVCAPQPGGPARSIDLPSIARAVAQSGDEEPLEGHGANICDTITFPNGCHVAEVEVDPETGQVVLLRYVAVDDFGRLLNPLLTEGQVHGGLAQGIGQALMEHSVYDPESGQLISATFTDYAVPRGEDLPELDIRFVEVPTAANPIGAKGSGQAGAIAAPQTIINAIVDALRPFGIDHIDMPATPQRVWQAIQDAGRREAS
ncbi:xanthine dehydrogenase family protein molybdopterin-binding subunit [Rhodoligotrophos defluvii]|uniref:xanthine dehydrogenase family protein molybdopterin-binding subunit n=1 Tax=Rhodoligotrophos defluvii TaxID=2561934 RepID=UPI0019604501|nr:xanthine dehydrogenase family protein molybdopterin-binding subunit [Rhodoligotrophos defluvii]